MKMFALCMDAALKSYVLGFKTHLNLTSIITSQGW